MKKSILTICVPFFLIGCFFAGLALVSSPSKIAASSVNETEGLIITKTLNAQDMDPVPKGSKIKHLLIVPNNGIVNFIGMIHANEPFSKFDLAFVLDVHKYTQVSEDEDRMEELPSFTLDGNAGATHNPNTGGQYVASGVIALPPGKYKAYLKCLMQPENQQMLTAILSEKFVIE